MFSFVRVRHGRRGDSRELRRAGVGRTRGRAVEGDDARCRHRRAEFTCTRRRSSSTPPARSSTDSTRRGVLKTDHRIVYSKGIHLVVPRLTTERAGAGVLRRHAAAVLRDPDGQAVASSAPPTRASTSRSPRSPTRTARSCSSRSTHGSTSTSRSPTADVDRRALRRAAAGGEERRAANMGDVDWTTLSAQARDRDRSSTPGSSPSSAAS